MKVLNVVVVGPILSYILFAGAIFGDVFAPLSFFTMYSDRLGIPYWRLFALLCVFLSAAIFLIPNRWIDSLAVKLSLFVMLSMTSATGLIGIYADQIRREKTAAFGADAQIEDTFLRSIREAPRDFQKYLHTAVLKDCVAYGWSYRSMSFYRIPPKAAKNVLPRSWLERCGQRILESDPAGNR